MWGAAIAAVLTPNVLKGEPDDALVDAIYDAARKIDAQERIHTLMDDPIVGLTADYLIVDDLGPRKPLTWWGKWKLRRWVKRIDKLLGEK